MPVTLSSISEAVLLVLALSTDAFVASFAYGTSRIKIPFASVAVINAVCSGVLAISLLIGTVISAYIPPEITKLICFFILLIIGVIKLFDSSIKSLIRKHKGLDKQLKFSMFNLHFILSIYADPQDADADASRVLSPLEAMALAISVSVDGLAAGFGAGLVSVGLIEAVLCSLLLGTAAVMLGCRIGNKVAQKTPLNIGWASGALLILLAFMKLIF